jgi:hypothetical protein
LSPLATQPVSQQTFPAGVCTTRVLGQQPKGCVALVVMHVVPSVQHPLPQHVFCLSQQWSPQHFWSSVQHFSPQQVAVFLQQMSDGQHFSLAEQHFPLQQPSPFLQQVLPHFFESLGHGPHVPGFPGLQRVRGGQHFPEQQYSVGLQQLTVLPPLHGVVRAGQQYPRSGSAHVSPCLQQTSPQHVSLPLQHALPQGRLQRQFGLPFPPPQR